MLILFSTGAALVRDGLVRNVRRIMPYMHWITGAMLALAGVYLTYYWSRVEFGSAATLNDDPIVGFVGDFTAAIEGFAGSYGRALVLTAGIVVAAIATAAAWKWFSRDTAPQDHAEAVPVAIVDRDKVSMDAQGDHSG